MGRGGGVALGSITPECAVARAFAVGRAVPETQKTKSETQSINSLPVRAWNIWKIETEFYRCPAVWIKLSSNFSLSRSNAKPFLDSFSCLMHILRLLDPKVKAYFQTLDATSVAPKDLMYTCSELWLFPCQLFFFWVGALKRPEYGRRSSIR